MSRLDRIVLSETQTEEVTSRLVASIEENGDLLLEGYDVGQWVENFWGDGDYEYWYRVPADYKDTILLWLLKERFTLSSSFKEWLVEKGIPSEFASWV